MNRLEQQKSCNGLSQDSGHVQTIRLRMPELAAPFITELDDTRFVGVAR